MPDPGRAGYAAGYACAVEDCCDAHKPIVDLIRGMVDAWGPRALVTIEDEHVMQLEAALLGVDAAVSRLREEGARA